jgi:butyryl-CoA dehydrogenase
MDYLLNDEQKMLRDTVARFAENEIAPVAAALEKEGRFPHEIIKKAGELGLMGLTLPEAYGGAGLDNISYMLAMEEVGKKLASMVLIMSTHLSLACGLIDKFGSEEQKKKYLPDLAAGRKVGSFSLTEPGAGSDAAALKTHALRQGETYVINGTKQFCTLDPGSDNVVLLCALTKPELKTKGISVFIVDRSCPGWKTGKKEHKLGIHSSTTSELIFEDCVVPAQNLLGVENEGFKYAMIALDGGRIGIACQALGIAKASIDAATAYAKEREQFGKPIASLQAIQWMLADMNTEYEAAWLLTYRAALMKDKGLRFTKEASMAKLKASETASFCADLAIQIHGGYGYIEEFNVERYYRDARITRIYEGTSEIQRLVIAQNCLK